jgi:(p)ppGpp synthase/HD superfamily hydrolase
VRFPSFVDDLPLTRRALEFAAARHGGQEREADRAPFILHPLEVAHLLHGRGLPDEVVAAGVLHDTVEDAQVTVEELRVHFGERIAALVGAVTEPAREGPYRKRKAALRAAVEAAEDDAVAIYAADKVAKVRELRMALAAGDGAMSAEKREHYMASLEMLERRLPGHPLVRQLRFELETLEYLPPRRGWQGI